MSTSRLQTTFARLAAEDRAAFVTYVMAGDPGPDASFEILTQLAGQADIIELGMPFSDPMAEGPAIQKAAQRSLKAGTKMRDVLDMVRRFRAADDLRGDRVKVAPGLATIRSKRAALGKMRRRCLNSFQYFPFPARPRLSTA